MANSRLEFSVVVSTHERPRQLTNLLAALAAQTFPHDAFEVIVVNDGGQTPLQPIVAAFRTTIAVRLINQANAGPAAGRNTGVTQARGAFVAFTDDDCAPVSDWLQLLHEALRSRPDAMVGGAIRNALLANRYSAASQLVGDIVYEFYNEDRENARFFSSNNLAVPADGLRKLGGFDDTFRIASEDRDLCERWRAAGGRLVFVPEALVMHSHHLSLGSFWRQHFRYGQGAAQFHHRRAQLGASRFEDHVAFHRAWDHWLLDPWRKSHSWDSTCTILLLLVWQLANAAGFFFGSLAMRLRPMSRSAIATSLRAESNHRRSKRAAGNSADR